MKKLELKGRIFGRLQVLKEHPHPTNTCWLCLCSCGNSVVVRTSKLTTGWTRSCGCLRNENVSARIRPFECLYKGLVWNAFAKFGRVELSYEEFLTFTIIDKCHYCEAPVYWTKFNVSKNGNAYNLDRKDNTKNYRLKNLVVCCARCNKGKQDQFSYEDWYGMTNYFRGGVR